MERFRSIPEAVGLRGILDCSLPAGANAMLITHTCLLSCSGLQLVMVGPIGDEYGEQAKHMLEKGG